MGCNAAAGRGRGRRRRRGSRLSIAESRVSPVTLRLNLKTLAGLPSAVRRPDYDFLNLGIGVVHLGLGAFHRAHQAVYTEDALRSQGGDWGIVGASFRHADPPSALAAQQQIDARETLCVLDVFRSALLF